MGLDNKEQVKKRVKVAWKGHKVWESERAIILFVNSEDYKDRVVIPRYLVKWTKLEKKDRFIFDIAVKDFKDIAVPEGWGETTGQAYSVCFLSMNRLGWEEYLIKKGA